MTPVVMLLLRSFSRIEKYAKLRTKPPLQEPPQRGFFTKKVTFKMGTKKKLEKKSSVWAKLVLKSRLFWPNDAR